MTRAALSCTSLHLGDAPFTLQMAEPAAVAGFSGRIAAAVAPERHWGAFPDNLPRTGFGGEQHHRACILVSDTQRECPGLTSVSDRHAGVLMAAGQQQRGMFIQTQPTPNPTSLMFMPGQGVMEVGPWARLDAVHLASVCLLMPRGESPVAGC